MNLYLVIAGILALVNCFLCGAWTRGNNCVWFSTVMGAWGVFVGIASFFFFGASRLEPVHLAVALVVLTAGHLVSFWKDMRATRNEAADQEGRPQ